MESKLPDQQAAAEAALTLIVDALAGGHMVHNIGYLESAYCGSLTQVALCDEIVAWIRQLQKPVALDDDALALDVIEKVGPGGLFLSTSTRASMRGIGFQPDCSTAPVTRTG